MHAYLLVGQGITNFQLGAQSLGLSISNLAKKLKAEILEYPIQKIEDSRSLNNLIRLSFDKPTLIVCQNVHEATEESLNAFLKNLEEPQENIYFALTAPSIRKVLPTIVSRCEVIRVRGERQEVKDLGKIEKFLRMSTGEKLAYTDKIKDRGEAVEFAENLVNFLHSKLHSNQVKYAVTAQNAEAATQLFTRLKGNGNINLQLTNFIIKYAE
jgi:DNA polymerase III gamma/tau subunit